jgi:hypothetical protein
MGKAKHMESGDSGAANGQRDVGGAGGGVGVLTVGQRVDRAGDTAQEAWSRTRETVSDIKERLDIQGRVERNPYGMMAAALGVGYLLGGGFFSPLTARIVGLGFKMGLRLAAIPFLESELRGLAESVVNGAGEGEGDTGDDDSGGEGRRVRRSKGTNKGR